jgi:hypothetical protein
LRLRELAAKFTVADTFLLTLLVTLSVASFFFVRNVIPHGTDVIVEVKGKLMYSLSLENNTRIEIPGARGITVVEIRDGKVRVAESSCPNKICVKQGWIDRGVIVCLPNQVVIRVGTEAHGTKQVDAITG